MAEQRQGGADKRNELAEVRTDTARRRTELANERTYSAWVRTGLAFLVSGFAATRLLNETGPTWLLTTVGVLLVSLGGVAFAVAYWSYRKSGRSDVGGLSSRLIGAITALLILLSAVAVVLVLVAAGG